MKKIIKMNVIRFATICWKRCTVCLWLSKHQGQVKHHHTRQTKFVGEHGVEKVVEKEREVPHNQVCRPVGDSVCALCCPLLAP